MMPLLSSATRTNFLRKIVVKHTSLVGTVADKRAFGPPVNAGARARSPDRSEISLHAETKAEVVDDGGGGGSDDASHS